ncbi:CHAD domain-containing protein [Aquabacterium sp.]|uniref:CYTH and CHAD domain-containing protein n=1 Tax=Aquabacterium sp. TaxID=1872578 RepID=UPI0035B20A28
MQEIELKLVVPGTARESVLRALQHQPHADGSKPLQQRLMAAYYDTPDRRLAHAGMALRVRKEGPRWVQTLKAGGPNALQRLEHNVPLRVKRGARPTVDPQRHAGTPAGEALATALAPRESDAHAPELIELYRTDIQRRSSEISVPGGVLELAFDEGWIATGERRVPVCELEIELVSGEPQAVIDQARHWIRSHGLWLDVHTKAHRGDHLARSVDPAPAAPAFPPLPADATLGVAWQRIHTTLLDALLDNASSLSSDRGTPDHVHALRVGLRRLRSTWKLFAPHGLAPGEATQDAAVALFRQLGPVRDADTLTMLWPRLQAAGCPNLNLPSTAQTLSAPDLLRGPSVSLLWLDLLETAVAGSTAESADRPARAPINERLRRWHRRAAKEAKAPDLNEAALHELRKRLKRLRDGVELGLVFLPRKAARRHLGVLREALDALGAFNDLLVAQARFHAVTEHEPRAWFALGWLAAHRQQSLHAAEAALKRWRRAEGFWRG